MKAMILAAFVALFAVPVSAAVIYEPETNTLEISGQNDSLQLLLVRTVLAKSQVDTVFMWGPGGSFYAGLSMGRMLKEHGAPRIIVPAGKDCVSACAFIAMSSDRVLIDGRMLFHRPYVRQVPAGLSIDDLSAKYGEVYLHAVAYAVEMGFSFDFAALVIAKTSPCVFFVVEFTEMLDALRGSPTELPTMQTYDACAARVENYG